MPAGALAVAQLYSEIADGISIKQKDLSDYLPISFGNMDSVTLSGWINIISKNSEDAEIFRNAISIHAFETNKLGKFMYFLPFISRVKNNENESVTMVISAVKTYNVDYGAVNCTKLVINYLSKD